MSIEKPSARKLLLSAAARHDRRGLYEEIRGLIDDFEKDRQPTILGQTPEYLAMVPKIAELYEKRAILWHGTGRFQYDAEGQVIDVLQSILQNEALSPREDEGWDRSRGPHHMIPLARSRMFASLYAKRFIPHGGRLTNELGERRLWQKYFIQTNTIVARVEYPPTAEDIAKGYTHGAASGNYQKKAIPVMQRVTRQPLTKPTDYFITGTDIDTNYPLLFGIKKEFKNHPHTSRWVELHEVRAEEAVPMAEISLIEVPQERVAEVSRMLTEAGYTDMLVIPIEYGEEYCRQFSFKELVSGRVLALKRKT